MVVVEEGVLGFYRAAMAGLRFLDGTDTRQRFGEDADAHWKGFAGHLRTQDRIDLLLRDAAVRWKAAFSPADVFQLSGLATDEPFGPDWQGINEDQARKLWRDSGDLAGGNLDAHLEGVLTPWSLLPLDTGPNVGDLTPATRLLVHGPAAIIAVAKAFAGQSGLSWASQVFVLADDPSDRHLAGLVAVLIEAGDPTCLLGSKEATDTKARPARFDRAIVSGQSSVEMAQLIHDLVG